MTGQQNTGKEQKGVEDALEASNLGKEEKTLLVLWKVRGKKKQMKRVVLHLKVMQGYTSIKSSSSGRFRNKLKRQHG